MRLKLDRIGMALLALAASAAPARAGAEWGGSYPPGRAQHLRLQGGVLFGFEGMVAETTRKSIEKEKQGYGAVIWRTANGTFSSNSA